jgi:multidrug efflux system membrane fusion protein
MPVQITVPGSRGDVLNGTARFLDNAVDQATGTIVMKAVVDNPQGLLTPGQFLNVSITLDRIADAVLVPNEAVQQGQDGHFLYVVKEDASVEMRKVEVLTSHQGRSAIGRGLSDGETVVTDGQLRLTPGASVRVKGGEAGKDKTPKAAEDGKPAAPAKS